MDRGLREKSRVQRRGANMSNTADDENERARVCPPLAHARARVSGEASREREIDDERVRAHAVRVGVVRRYWGGAEHKYKIKRERVVGDSPRMRVFFFLFPPPPSSSQGTHFSSKL